MKSDGSLLIMLVLGALFVGLFIGLILFFTIESNKEEPSDGFLIFSVSILGTLAVTFLGYFIWKAIKKSKVKKEYLGTTEVTQEKPDPFKDYDVVTETTKRTELVPGENDKIINEINYVTVNHNFYPKKDQ